MTPPEPGCYICGKDWNEWCVEHHLPFTRIVFARQEDEIERIRASIVAAETFVVPGWQTNEGLRR